MLACCAHAVRVATDARTAHEGQSCIRYVRRSRGIRDGGALCVRRCAAGKAGLVVAVRLVLDTFDALPQLVGQVGLGDSDELRELLWRRCEADLLARLPREEEEHCDGTRTRNRRRQSGGCGMIAAG